MLTFNNQQNLVIIDSETIAVDIRIQKLVVTAKNLNKFDWKVKIKWLSYYF